MRQDPEIAKRPTIHPGKSLPEAIEARNMPACLLARVLGGSAASWASLPSDYDQALTELEAKRA